MNEVPKWFSDTWVPEFLLPSKIIWMFGPKTAIFAPKYASLVTYGSISPRREKWSKCDIFLELCRVQTVCFFQLFSTKLERFCPLDSKNVFILVLAHLEPELELFEVDDIGDDGDDDFIC